MRNRIMAKTLIKNIGCLYSGDVKNPVLSADSIIIEDGKIAEVGNGLSADDATVIDAKGTTVMPGLLDSHVHTVIGTWTPRQEAMDWVAPYVASGVTGLISVGETHIPGKPKNAIGMKALSILAKQTFDNVRPSKMKVYGGAYIMHTDAKKEDFVELKSYGVKNTGEIGLGTCNAAHLEDTIRIRGYAKEAGMPVVLHRGDPYLHGSAAQDPDSIVAIQPDVICHCTIGRCPDEEIHRYFEECPDAVIELTTPQLSYTSANTEVINTAVRRGQKERVIFGNDCPSGFGLYPHGIWDMVLFAAAFADVNVGEAIAMATGNTGKTFDLGTGIVEAGQAADFVICDAPVGSDYADATAAIAAGTMPAVSMVLIDGEIVAEGNKCLSAPAKSAATH